jgi:excisionase family DNA binding protein
MDTSPSDLLTAAEVARWLRRTVHTVYLWTRTQGLPYHRLGPRGKLFSRADVQRWLDDRKTVELPRGGAREPAQRATPQPVVTMPAWDGVRRRGKRLAG